jgi:hypothetical protein
VRHCPEDLRPGSFVQSGDAMLRDTDRFVRLRELLTALLNALAG